MIRHIDEKTELYPSNKSLEILQADYFDSLQETAGKYKHIYILVVADAFTRFTWLYSTRSTGTKEVVDRLFV